MNRQEIFDKVVIGLRDQGYLQSRSNEINYTCCYRAPDGKKCAVGHLIPDENYHPVFEGRSLRCEDIILALPSEVRVHRRMLQTLQAIHDGSQSPEKMRTGLYRYAGQHNLDTKELD